MISTTLKDELFNINPQNIAEQAISLGLTVFIRVSRHPENSTIQAISIGLTVFRNTIDKESR